MRKPAFCTCENKDADQLRGNREADQCLCFRHTDCTIPLPPNSEISSLFCGCTAQFLSDPVGKPEDRFSHIEAQLYLCHTQLRSVCLFYHASSQRKQNLIQLTFSLSKLLNIVIPYV